MTEEVLSRSVSKRWIASLILATFSLLTLVQGLSAAQLLKSPYLIFPGDPTQMIVLWQLRPNLPCELSWGRTEELLDGSIECAGVEETRLNGAANVFGGRFNSPWPSNSYQYQVTLTDLVPGQRYYYRVEFGEEHYAGSFTAAPPRDATSVRFLAIADSQYGAHWVEGPDNKHVGEECFTSVAGEILNLLRADHGLQTMMLHGGDWVNNSFEWSWHLLVQNPRVEELFGMVPVQGTTGNHDIEEFGRGEDAYGKYWPYPYVDAHYWSFDYGPVHVVVLHPDEGFADPSYPCLIRDELADAEQSPQLLWLREDLEQNKLPWTILLVHYPVSSDLSSLAENDDANESGARHSLSFSRPRTLSKNLAHVVNDSNVDLILVGHEHWPRIFNFSGVPCVAIGSSSDLAANRCHYQILDVNEERIQIDTFDLDGLLHSTTIASDGSVVSSLLSGAAGSGPPNWDDVPYTFSYAEGAAKPVEVYSGPLGIPLSSAECWGLDGADFKGVKIGFSSDGLYVRFEGWSDLSESEYSYSLFFWHPVWQKGAVTLGVDAGSRNGWVNWWRLSGSSAIDASVEVVVEGTSATVHIPDTALPFGGSICSMADWGSGYELWLNSRECNENFGLPTRREIVR